MHPKYFQSYLVDTYVGRTLIQLIQHILSITSTRHVFSTKSQSIPQMVSTPGFHTKHTPDNIPTQIPSLLLSRKSRWQQSSCSHASKLRKCPDIHHQPEARGLQHRSTDLLATDKANTPQAGIHVRLLRTLPADKHQAARPRIFERPKHSPLPIHMHAL